MKKTKLAIVTTVVGLLAVAAALTLSPKHMEPSKANANPIDPYAQDSNSPLLHTLSYDSVSLTNNGTVTVQDGHVIWGGFDTAITQNDVANGRNLLFTCYYWNGSTYVPIYTNVPPGYKGGTWDIYVSAQGVITLVNNGWY